MGKAKNIQVKPIPASVARAFVRKNHYSGKVVPNSRVHLGVFYLGGLHGVMSFGPSLDKKKTIGLVKGTGWNGFIELNRMAFDDFLPRNSESRALSIAFRLFKQFAPTIKWIVSFADATQCGSGTIYRAAGFLLTKITPNKTIWVAPNGKVATDLSLRLGLQTGHTDCVPSITSHKTKENKGASSMRIFKEAGYKPLAGYQIRYVYFLDKSKQKDLNCDIIPFSELDKLVFPDGVRHKEYLKKTCANSVDKAQRGSTPQVAV
jgi:hypothetical protein